MNGVEEVRDYFDAVKPGMRDLLINAEKARDTEEIDMQWVKLHNMDLAENCVDLFRALKKLTEDNSEARQVVTSVPGEDGFAAWVKLHKRFGMALAMKQGTTRAAFSYLGPSG